MGRAKKKALSREKGSPSPTLARQARRARAAAAAAGHGEDNGAALKRVRLDLDPHAKDAEIKELQQQIKALERANAGLQRKLAGQGTTGGAAAAAPTPAPAAGSASPLSAAEQPQPTGAASGTAFTTPARGAAVRPVATTTAWRAKSKPRSGAVNTMVDAASAITTAAATMSAVAASAQASAQLGSAAAAAMEGVGMGADAAPQMQAVADAVRAAAAAAQATAAAAAAATHDATAAAAAAALPAAVNMVALARELGESINGVLLAAGSTSSERELTTDNLLQLVRLSEKYWASLPKELTALVDAATMSRTGSGVGTLGTRHSTVQGRKTLLKVIVYELLCKLRNDKVVQPFSFMLGLLLYGASGSRLVTDVFSHVLASGTYATLARWRG